MAWKSADKYQMLIVLCGHSLWRLRHIFVRCHPYFRMFIAMAFSANPYDIRLPQALLSKLSLSASIAINSPLVGLSSGVHTRQPKARLSVSTLPRFYATSIACLIARSALRALKATLRAFLGWGDCNHTPICFPAASVRCRILFSPLLRQSSSLLKSTFEKMGK